MSMEFTIVEARRPRARRSTWIVLDAEGNFSPFTDICASLREAVTYVAFKLNVAEVVAPAAVVLVAVRA